MICMYSDPLYAVKKSVKQAWDVTHETSRTTYIKYEKSSASYIAHELSSTSLSSTSQ